MSLYRFISWLKNCQTLIYISFRFTEKLIRKYRVPIYSFIPIINSLCWCGTFGTIDEPVLIHYDQFIVYIRTHSLLYNSLGFNKSTMLCVHHFAIIQNSFSALKTLVALLIGVHHLFQSLAPSNFFFYCVHMLLFLKCHIVRTIQHVAFSNWLPFTQQCASKFSLFVLMFYFFLLGIPLYGCTILLFIYLLKDIQVASRFWQL